MLLGACDPWYTVGARVRLGPPAPDSCVLASLRQSFGRAPLEGISLRPGWYISIRMPIDSTLESSDSAAGSLQGNSKLLIEPQKDSALLLEVSTGWMGTAATVPTASQRRYVAAAISRLQEVRAACAPKSSREVECLAGAGAVIRHAVPGPSEREAATSATLVRGPGGDWLSRDAWLA